MQAPADVEDVLERIDDPFFALDEEWRFTYLNERAVEVLDVDRDHVLGGSVWDHFEPAVRTTFQREYERAMETQESVSFEEYYPPLETWFEVDAYPTESGLSVYFRDITDRREERMNLELYDQILETVEDGVYVLDPDNQFVMVNDAFCELVGRSREELRGRKATVVKDDAIVAEIDSLVSELAVEDRENAIVEFKIETSDGERIPVEDHISRISFDADWGRCGIVRDISERERRERELERTRDLLARTERIADVGGWEIDLETMDIFWTDHLFDILGWEGDEEPSLDEALEGYIEADRPKVEQAVEEATESGEKFDLEARFDHPAGDVRWLRIQGVPIVEDGDVVALRGAADDITDRKEFERKLIALQEVAIDLLEEGSTESVAEQVTGALADILDTPSAWFYRYDPHEGVLRTAATTSDSEFSLDELPTVVADDGNVFASAFHADETKRLTDLTASAQCPETDTQLGVRGLVVAPVNDHGVLCAGSPEVGAFDEQLVELVDILATTAAAAFRRVAHEQVLHVQRDRLAALKDINSLVHDLSASVFTLSGREEIEQLVCRRLAESDAYEFAWIGAAEDGTVTVRSEAGVEGYLDDITLSLTESPSAAGPTAQAHLTGEMQVVRDAESDPQYEPWRGRTDEYGYHSSASIPIGDGDQHGTLNVYSARSDAFSEEERDALRRLGSIIGYAFASVERERTLQRERNRLEFMNRLLRHNLLNSLNVVTSRLKMLDGRVDYEMVDHLETAIDRTEEMATFVETIREVTNVIGHSKEHELEPKALDDVLTNRVRMAQQSHPEAQITLLSDPAVDVVADELLGEVLDNVLINAVQHNPDETPGVWVDTAVHDDSVEITVADDGPGIPDEKKETIFDRDVKDFDDPGTGFGLYLVHEIMDSYDGSITVTDNEPTGTVFTLTFQRP